MDSLGASCSHRNCVSRRKSAKQGFGRPIGFKVLMKMPKIFSLVPGFALSVDAVQAESSLVGVMGQFRSSQAGHPGSIFRGEQGFV